MKFFETLWDLVAGDKKAKQAQESLAPVEVKPKRRAQSQASAPQAVSPKAQLQNGVASRKPKRRAAPKSRNKPAQANVQSLAPESPVVETPALASPALATPALAEPPTAFTPNVATTRKELQKLMCLPAAGGTLPVVPEKLPRILRDRYEVAMKLHLEHYDIRVRKWRKSSSGIAWCVAYRSGRIQRLIESPRPLTPLSCAIFLHEVGHHAIGLGIHHPRCLEEYLAWMYSLQQMKAWGIEISPRVQQRVQRSLRYAVRKAVRRGIRELPPELEAYR
jgi:hypothetical protein